MKTERFIIEYANYIKKGIDPHNFPDKPEKIDRILFLRSMGLITVNESIRMLMEV